MQLSRKKRGVGAVLVTAVVAGLFAALLTPAAGGASTPRVATATGGKITVAGLGYAQTFGDAGVGAAARFQAANENKEVKGYTFDYKELADDKNDPATSLSEARRLVTQEGVLAIVPAVSVVTPSDFLTQQQIPWFGVGYDVTYCPEGATGFGISAYGCLIPTNPKKIPGTQWIQLKKQLATKGIANPTLALLGTDTTSGKQSVQNSASAAEGAGFKVVYAKGAFPGPPAVVSDFSPYSQALLAANDGKAPDVIYSSIAPTSALTLTSLLNNSGYTGTYLSPFYSPLLVSALKGAYVFLQFAGFEADSPGIKTMNEQIEAFKPGTKPSLALSAGYFSADMFIQAVKNSLKSSKTLTSASVQKAAAKMTYQIKDTVGPTQYPASFKIATKSCSTLEYDAAGTAFEIVQPFFCTNKTYPVLPKYSGG
jgi:ABC-type branched-subunit amino acid transport system substrate-binding protein